MDPEGLVGLLLEAMLAALVENWDWQGTSPGTPASMCPLCIFRHELL